MLGSITMYQTMCLNLAGSDDMILFLCYIKIRYGPNNVLISGNIAVIMLCTEFSHEDNDGYIYIYICSLQIVMVGLYYYIIMKLDITKTRRLCLVI